MNKTILTGRIANDLEVRKTQNGKSILMFAIAVDKGTKDENGNREVQFIDIQAWESTADYLAKYAGKGTMVAVEGKLNCYISATKNGEQYKKVNVVADRIEIMSWNRNEDPKQTTTRKQDVNGGGYAEIKADDLPFY